MLFEGANLRARGLFVFEEVHCVVVVADSIYVRLRQAESADSRHSTYSALHAHGGTDFVVGEASVGRRTNGTENLRRKALLGRVVRQKGEQRVCLFFEVEVHFWRVVQLHAEELREWIDIPRNSTVLVVFKYVLTRDAFGQR